MNYRRYDAVGLRDSAGKGVTRPVALRTNSTWLACLRVCIQQVCSIHAYLLEFCSGKSNSHRPWWQFRAAVERLNVTFCCALRWPILYGCSHLVVLARWRLIPVDPFCSAWSWWMPWKLRQCLVSPEWHLLLSATVRTADRQINIIGCIYVYIYDIQKYLSIYWIG